MCSLPVSSSLLYVPVSVAAGEEVSQVVHRTEHRPHVQEVDGGGTHGEEGDVHPGPDLQTEHLGLPGLNHLAVNVLHGHPQQAEHTCPILQPS